MVHDFNSDVIHPAMGLLSIRDNETLECKIAFPLAAKLSGAALKRIFNPLMLTGFVKIPSLLYQGFFLITTKRCLMLFPLSFYLI